MSSSVALPSTKTIIKKILPENKHIRTLGPVFTYPKQSIRPRRIEFGLYHGKSISFGNQTCFSEKKTRRTWKPNVHVVKLYSETFDQRLRLKATTHALKCIDKMGGLDSYLLQTKKEKIDSRFGLWLRKQILNQRHKNELAQRYQAKVDWHAQKLAEAMKTDLELRESVMRQESFEAVIKTYQSLPSEEKDLCERFEAIELNEARRRQLDANQLKKMTTKKQRLSKKQKYAKGDPYHNFALEFQTNPDTVAKLQDNYQKKLQKLEKLRGNDKVHPMELDIY